MNDKCKSCGSCGMPMEKKEDFALSDASSLYCSYCTDKTGKLLAYDDILKANASFYKESQGMTDQAALKMATDLLNSQPDCKNLGA
jgi:hypothetical protein